MPSPNAAAASRSARGDRVGELVGAAHDAHAAPAAAGRRLHQRGQTDLGERLDGGVGQHRHARCARISRLASIFEPIAAIAAGGGPIHARPASTTAWANAAFSDEEAVAGMDGVGAGAQGGVDQQVAAQVGVGRRVARQADGGVGLADERRVGVGVAVHGDGRDAEPPAGADDAAGDLAAVGDEHAIDASGECIGQSHPEHAVAACAVDRLVVDRR